MAEVGYIAAVLSAVFNGSFTTPYKLRFVADYKLHPILFMLYVSTGVFLSSWLIIPILPYNDNIIDDDEIGTSFAFTPFGLLAGCLLVIALSSTFLAIAELGVCLATGTFGGT